MADREVKVRISGSETVSDAAKKAEGGLSGFTSKISSLAKGIGALVAGGALAAFFKSAVDEAGKAEVGMARLGNAVTNAGGDFATLRPEIEETVASVMKLSTATDDDLREALTRMIAITGDTQGSLKNLSLVTDLAAFKQVDLETAALSVAKAMTGNTMELNRLGVAGTSATAVIENARAAFGGFAASEAKTFSGSLLQIKNQWGEFKEAVGVAILSTGEMGAASGGLATVLGNLAQWVEKNQDGIRTFTNAVFAIVGAVGTFAGAIWDVVGPPLTWLAKVAFVGVVAGLNTIALGLKRTAATFQEFAGTALEAIGNVVEKGGKILKLFGIEVVSETGTALKQFGAQLHAEGVAANAKAVTDFQASMGKLGTVIKGGETQHTNVVRTGAAARTTIRQKEAKDAEASHLEMEMARNKATRAANELLAETAALLKKQNLEQYAEQWAQIDRNVRKVKGDLADTLPPADQLKQSIDENAEAMRKNAEAAKDNKKEISDTVGAAAQLGRAFIDAGQAAGVLSAEAASALNSVINMATSLAEFGLGSVQGIIGVVSGLANILSGIGDGPAAKAVKANTMALERLTREVGNLDLSATGKAFKGTEAAIQATIQKFRGAPQNEVAGKAAMDFFRKELLRQGVSRDEAEELIKELGFGDVFASGKAFIQSLPQLQTGFKETEFGQFGQDFESQLAALQDSFEVFGVEKPEDQLAGFGDLAKKFSPAIADALSGPNAGGNLRDLFNQLITGGLDPSQFGDLSGEQFLELIKILIPLVDAAGTGGTPLTVGKEPVDKAVSGGKTKGIVGLDPNTPITTPPRTDLLGALLTGGGTPGDAAASGDLLGALLTGGGKAGDPSGLGELLGKLGMPVLPGDMTPTLPPLGKRPGMTTDGDLGGHFEQKIGTYIQGDQHHTYQITPKDTTDPQEIAEIVRRAMADSYTLQRQSLGLG